MIEQKTTFVVPSFKSARLEYTPPAASMMVAEGDRNIYELLTPLSERAHDYRDTIDVANHISGITAVLRRARKGPGRMLYLASSYGTGPLMLEGMGYRVVSLDKDKPALGFAQKFTRNPVAADAKHLPFADNSMESVVSRDFLAQDYHMLSKNDRITIIKEIHRVLKTDGLAIFYTLYTKKAVNGIGREIKDGLPDIDLLEDFSKVEKIKTKFRDNPNRNSLVYIAVK